MCPDLCVITVKKTSILVPSLTQQNKGVQPDCLKLLELPSQRVGQGGQGAAQEQVTLTRKFFGAVRASHANNSLQ